MPVNRKIRAVGGVEYEVSDGFLIGANFAYAHLGSARLRNSQGCGDYSRNDLLLAAITASWTRLHWRRE
ncbi:MAG: hypothetical protein JRG76_16810 [Deltaproteobacteria bacterium]|nr:hypothetical protein [Deltaproteobacteria bacterium]